MREFLESNGFKLEEYPDGLFWVKIAMNTDCGCDSILMQADEKFERFTIDYDGWPEDLSKEEFKAEVNKIK